MIGFLRGFAIARVDDVITLEVDKSVGYEIHTAADLSIDGKFIALWIHEHAPQDAPHELYGFSTIAERDLFRRLLDIKGVGPKVAMRIVASYPATTDRHRWVESDLCKIRGVGGTLAQRIVEAML